MRVSEHNVILLVEDDPNDVELVLRVFRKTALAGRTVVVRDGVEALDYLRCAGPYASRPAVLPQVVLLDLNLPVLDGLEVLRRIRADDRTRRVPVVILTSSNEDSDKITGYDLGANSFVRKPVDFRQFSAAITGLGQYWTSFNEPPPQG